MSDIQALAEAAAEKAIRNGSQIPYEKLVEAFINTYGEKYGQPA